MDVDLVVEATTYVEYERFGKRLASVGFGRSYELGDPLCRWRLGSLVLDVMPLEEKILGFSNRWYSSAVRSRWTRMLPAGAAVHHLDAPHFLATKLEAFSARGSGDFCTSSDLEDVVRVVDGRPSLAEELARPSPELESPLLWKVSASARSPRLALAVGKLHSHLHDSIHVVPTRT